MRHRIAAGIVTCAVLAIPARGDGRLLSERTGRWTPSAQYLKQRGGVVGVGVIDSQGRVRGIHDTAPLRHGQRDQGDAAGQLPAEGGPPGARRSPAYERSHLRPMIRVSSNSAATWAYNRRRRSAAAAARAARRHGPVLDLLLVGLRALQRARPGEVLLAARPRSRRRASAITPRTCCARSSPRRAGASRASGARAASRSSSRAAGAAPPAAARAPGVVPPLPRRRLLARGADRRQPVDGLRDPDDRGRRAQDPAPEARLRPNCVQCSVYVDRLVGSALPAEGQPAGRNALFRGHDPKGDALKRLQLLLSLALLARASL